MKIDAEIAKQFLDDSSSVKIEEATEITVEGAAILVSRRSRDWPWYGPYMGICTPSYPGRCAVMEQQG